MTKPEDHKPWGDSALAGDALREWRRTHGLSQRQLAEMVGTSQGVISKWEHLDRRPIGLYAEALRRVMSEAKAGAGSSLITPAP